MFWYRILVSQVYLLIIGISIGYTQSHTHYFGKSYYNVTAIPQRNITNTTLEYNTSKKVIKIKVFYETLCPASVEFFTTQLLPAVEKLGSHLDVHLVPYGHAKTLQIDNQYRFRCQHGSAECHGNRIHACAVAVLQNNTQAAIFNACLMRYTVYTANVGYDYVSALNTCGFKLNIVIRGIWQCVHSERGSSLLKGYGDETHALHPRYVPYVVLGDAAKQNRASGNLVTTICSMLTVNTTECHGVY